MIKETDSTNILTSLKDYNEFLLSPYISTILLDNTPH